MRDLQIKRSGDKSVAINPRTAQCRAARYGRYGDVDEERTRSRLLGQVDLRCAGPLRIGGQGADRTNAPDVHDVSGVWQSVMDRHIDLEPSLNSVEMRGDHAAVVSRE